MTISNNKCFFHKQLRGDKREKESTKNQPKYTDTKRTYNGSIASNIIVFKGNFAWQPPADIISILILYFQFLLLRTWQLFYSQAVGGYELTISQKKILKCMKLALKFHLIAIQLKGYFLVICSNILLLQPFSFSIFTFLYDPYCLCSTINRSKCCWLYLFSSCYFINQISQHTH